jgi:outer membrane protein insertion porin family
MTVAGHELLPGSEPRRLVLKVIIDEGRLYHLGSLKWEGNHVLSPIEVRRIWNPRPGEIYDLSRLDRTRAEAYSQYAERGFLFVRIEPVEVTRDSLVDVTFQVTEGDASSIRYVVISGNKGTREKVIRREIDIHEGDRFKRSSLVRSRDNIMRLGIFEDVGVDFATTESNDVDVLLKVKEKQVGTASAGAGYTNESGLTGFLELGHNNVLGNSQSLQLHLERGGRLSNYFVSFNEPWFHDTPTLLGFSMFNTSTNRDLYVENRRGASVRLGRPLRWPDFSRGSFSYQLEGVKLDPLGPMNAADSAALHGVVFGQRMTTSSIQLGLTRNSSNNPFYPTHGTRLTITSQLAGGPLGGSVSFHKQRVEARAYMPSILRGITTMMKARFGILGDFGNPARVAPAYETFRLGGGSTLDPLRGYDDYQVVPKKFDTFVPVRVFDHWEHTTPTDSVAVYRFVQTRVRYPGGNYFTTYTFEQQFPIVHPLHGVLFFDAGNTWNLWKEIQPLDLRTSAGVGFRMEIPLLGNIGFDYGYGFKRDDGPRAVGHFLLGNVNF